MHGMSGSTCPCASPSDPAHQATLYKDGNDFLRTWVTAITHSKAWTGNSSIFITGDEGSYADGPATVPSTTGVAVTRQCQPTRQPTPPTAPGATLRQAPCTGVVTYR